MRSWNLKIGLWLSLFDLFVGSYFYTKLENWEKFGTLPNISLREIISVEFFILIRGAIHSLFKCTNDFNEYLISGDYVSDFNNVKILWYHRLHIVLGDFRELHMIWILFIRFQCDFMRFQTLSESTTKVSTDSISSDFLRLHFWFKVMWFNDSNSQ